MPHIDTLGIYGIQDRGEFEYPNFVHDHSLAYFHNGSVEKFVQLERLTRKKHDNSLQKNLHNLLKENGLISSSKYDVVFSDNVVGRAFISSDGNMRFEAPLLHKLENKLEEGKCWWYNKEIKGFVLNHELAHIYSCVPFFGKFKENSLLFHFDGGASQGNYSAWLYKNGNIECIEYGWELKYLSAMFNANALSFAIIGAKHFDQNSVPGKLMGFGSFGKYSERLELWLKKNNYFENIWSKKNLFFDKVKNDWGIEIKNFDQRNSFLQDIAATFQEIFNRDLIQKVEELKRKTGADYLYYSGGSALSIVANTLLVEKNLFKDVFIPPCCSDSGLALGAAAALEIEKEHEVNLHSPYLCNIGIEEYQVEYTQETIEAIGSLLIDKKVIGVCNGYGEIGPRALGNRSILALASSKELADKVSVEHKDREWYRPVAPIMLEKNAKYFTGKEEINHLSKYMLLDFDILPERQAEIEGVVHINKTSRIQTVYTRDDNPFIYDLLTWLDSKGVRALINTSFNKRGEPIVHTEQDAEKSARNMKLDAVVLNGRLLIL